MSATAFPLAWPPAGRALGSRPQGDRSLTMQTEVLLFALRDGEIVLTEAAG